MLVPHSFDAERTSRIVSTMFPKKWWRLLPLVVVALVSACSTTESRIAAKRDVFNSWPMNVQQAVMEGRVEPGMTPEMVEMALGRPAQKIERTSAGEKREIWIYKKRKPSFGIGIGVGMGGGNTSVGTGVGVTTRPEDEGTRVIFQGGEVTEVEEARR